MLEAYGSCSSMAFPEEMPDGLLVERCLYRRPFRLSAVLRSLHRASSLPSRNTSAPRRHPPETGAKGAAKATWTNFDQPGHHGTHAERLTAIMRGVSLSYATGADFRTALGRAADYLS